MTDVSDFNEKPGPGILRSYWPIIVGALAFAASWGATTSQMGSLSTGQERMTAVQEKMSVKIDSISDSVSGMKAATAAAAASTGTDIADLRVRLRVLEARR